MLIQKIVLGIALAGIAVATTEASAQSFKELIAGAWIVTSVFDEYSNGEKKDNWGGPVKAKSRFGRTGRFTSDSRWPRSSRR